MKRRSRRQRVQLDSFKGKAQGFFKKARTAVKDSRAPHKLKAFATHPKVKKVAPYILVALVFFGLGFTIRRFIPIAIVNGTAIDRIEYNERLLKNAGKATLEEIIIEDLIEKELEKRDVQVTDKEFQNQLDIVMSSLEQQNATLDQYLLQTGQTREEFEKQIRSQLAIKKLFEKEAKVSEEEIEKFYEDNEVEKGEGAILVSQEIAITQALSQQKTRIAYSTWLAKELEKAKVTRFIQF